MGTAPHGEGHDAHVVSRSSGPGSHRPGPGTGPLRARDTIIRKKGIPMTAPNAGYDIEGIKKKALIWTIVGFLCGGVIAGVLGLLGYLKADQEPETAQKVTKWAMIGTILVIVLYALISSGSLARGVFGASVSTH